MRPTSVLTAILALPAAGLAANAPPSKALVVSVRETAGIRRGNFPTHAVVRLAQGSLREVANLRLVLDEKEVPVQASAGDRWPDGSLRDIGLHFNTSIGPLAERQYRLEIGGTARTLPVSSERLEVIESANGIQVGKVRFAREPAALLQSVAFGREIVGDGLNAFSLTDETGAIHLLGGDVTIEIVEPGPLAARIRYTGSVRIADDYAVPFTITLDIPNTKSWVRYEAHIEDPLRRVRELTLDTSFRLGSFPWTWDFGTGSWSYGAFREATDSAVFTQTIGGSQASDWQIATGPEGREQPYERAAAGRPTLGEGWGHLQGADRAVAFSVDGFGAEPGQYTLALDGHGQISIRFAPVTRQSRRSLAVYQHYVASPVPIGAATSPVAMASPLVVTVRP